MRTIIAGSRGIISPAALHFAVEECPWDITEVVSGGARGVDRMGEEWAESRGLPVKRFPAQWDKHGRAAGPIRNAEMARYAEALLALWDGQSRGTKNMIENAQKMGLKVHVVTINT